MAENQGGSVLEFRGAFVSNVVASTKRPGDCYVDLVGAFGQANFRTTIANKPQLDQLQAAGVPVTLRCNAKWQRFGKDTSITVTEIGIVQAK